MLHDPHTRRLIADAQIADLRRRAKAAREAGAVRKADRNRAAASWAAPAATRRITSRDVGRELRWLRWLRAR